MATSDDQRRASSYRPPLAAKGAEEDERVKFQRRTGVLVLRGGQKLSSKCEASINQHDPSFENRDRGTDADDAVQGTSSTCHRGAAMEYEGSNTSAKNKLVGPSGGLYGWGDMHKRSDASLTSTHTVELAIHSSGEHTPRREEDVQAVCLRHRQSDALSLSAG